MVITTWTPHWRILQGGRGQAAPQCHPSPQVLRAAVTAAFSEQTGGFTLGLCCCRVVSKAMWGWCDTSCSEVTLLLPP